MLKTTTSATADNSLSLAEIDPRQRWQLRPPNQFPSPWASEWGFDQYGLWQAIKINEVSCKFRFIPCGQFYVGEYTYEMAKGKSDEQEHVKLDNGFWLSETPVTFEFWDAVVGYATERTFFSGPYQPGSYQAPYFLTSKQKWQKFFQLLNQAFPSGQFTLPNEVQWEYACKAGTRTPFNTGSDLNSEQANFYKDNQEIGQTKVTDVKHYPPNQWGLYDMHGNVWECCYHSAHLGFEEYSLEGSDNFVLRGGSYLNKKHDCASHSRLTLIDNKKMRRTLGFRILINDTEHNHDSQQNEAALPVLNHSADSKKAEKEIDEVKTNITQLKQNLLESLNSNPDPISSSNIQVELAQLHHRTANNEEAIELLESALTTQLKHLEEHELNLIILILLIKLYLESGNFKASFTHFFHLTNIYEGQEQFEQAIEYSRNYLAKLSDTQYIVLTAQRIIGLYQRLGQYHLAIEFCQTIMAENDFNQDDILLFEEYLDDLGELSQQTLEQEIADYLNDGELNSLIQHSLESHINDAIVYPTGDGYPTPQCDEGYSHYLDHSLHQNSQGAVEFDIDFIGNDEIQLKLSAEVSYQVTAVFSFDVKDSIDKDYIHLSTREISKNFTLETEITVTLLGAFDQPDFDFDEMEIAGFELGASIEQEDHDFGYIETYGE